MNLLMISGDRSVPQGKRGAFWYTLEEFARHWDRIDVLCPRSPGGGRGACTIHGRVHFHPSPWGLAFQPKWIAWKGRMLHAEHGIDVMTVHEYPPMYNGFGAYLLHCALRIPYALEIHHVVGYPRPSSPAEALGRLISRALLPLDARPASAVRVVNAATKTLLSSWDIPAKKIHVVPSFYLDAQAIGGAKAAGPSFDIACCGRLVPNKKFDAVLRAVARIPSVTCGVIGDGPDRRKLERLAQHLGIGDRVRFLGWMADQAAVYGAMKSAKVFVMNSASEGGPRVLLEAMALGLPVLATRVGIAADVVHDDVNGLFTDGTPDDLAAKLRVLLADPARRASLGSAALSILRTFDRSALIAEYAHFLRSLA